MTDRLAELSAQGVAVWLDDLSRVRLTTGSLDKMRREQHVVGVTTNPSIFQKALSDADAYDAQVKDLAAQRVSVEEAVRLMTAQDVRERVRRRAAGVRRVARAWTAGCPSRSTRASAHETEKHRRRGEDAVVARRPGKPLHQDPGDPGGPAGDHRDAGRGHQRQRDADLLARALPRGHGRVPGRHRAGQGERPRHRPRSARWRRSSSPGSTPRSTSASTRSAATRPRRCKGKAAIANAQLAYEAYTEVFGTDRWKALADAGAHPQRPLWASTSTKNPDYKDTIYVEELIAPGDGQHHAGVGDLRVRGPRRDPRRHRDRRVRAGQARSWPTSRRSASTSTTSSRCSRTRASTSSRSAGRSCSRASQKSLKAAAQARTARATPPDLDAGARRSSAGPCRTSPARHRKLAGWTTWAIRCVPHRTAGSRGSRSPVLW